MISIKKVGMILALAAVAVSAQMVFSMLAIHSAEKSLAAEHASVIALQEENAKLKLDVANVETAADTVRFQITRPAPSGCENILTEQVRASLDRLKAKTFLINLEEEATATAAIHFPGSIGAVLDLIQQVNAQNNKFARVGNSTHIWILPTSMEPIYSGDASRAWVIHVDAKTGKPVDQPHHPYPAQ